MNVWNADTYINTHYGRRNNSIKGEMHPKNSVLYVIWKLYGDGAGRGHLGLWFAFFWHALLLSPGMEVVCNNGFEDFVSLEIFLIVCWRKSHLCLLPVRLITTAIISNIIIDLRVDIFRHAAILQLSNLAMHLLSYIICIFFKPSSLSPTVIFYNSNSNVNKSWSWMGTFLAWLQ